MKLTTVFGILASLAPAFAQKVVVEEWLGGDCNGRAFLTPNVNGGTGATAVVNVEQLDATNMRFKLIEGCTGGKTPTVEVSTNPCSDFVATASLHANGACIPVDYTPVPTRSPATDCWMLLILWLKIGNKNIRSPPNR
ncbi:hypothetical protein EDB81DRAFT_769136 [Dactylonectria macrodidyma]|uniref:Uncharacterized protein n=1 Tax=Dactylonectria macrodidyma TaxID=307937 RepID=A0A9P9CZ71_9HYPO|nr:hypothetical protein EDB81DRAFT_769136 [Dactylonectria macrodidyma]